MRRLTTAVPTRIYTWGYRGKTHDDLRTVIQEHNISAVVDVRSRTSGARVAKLWQYLSLERGGVLPTGVVYSWNCGLGNRGKTAWTRGVVATASLLHEALMCLDEATLLLCAEPDHEGCHRTEVAEAIANIIRAAGGEAEVVHL